MSSPGSETPPDPKSELDRAKLRQDKLLKVYEAALAEYRFDVQLAWDRAKFILGLCVTALAAGAGLARLAEGSGGSWLILSGFFLLVAGFGWIGLRAGAEAKRRYRAAVHAKLVVESKLGLLEPLDVVGRPATLEVGGRPGVIDLVNALRDRDDRADRGSDKGAVTYWIDWIFRLIIALATGCAAMASWQAVRLFM